MIRMQPVPMLLLICALFVRPAFADGPRDCASLRSQFGESSILKTRLAGVPAILSIPKVITKPPIVLWHGFGAPASKEALMKALPLDQVPAVKVYLDLPLFGERTPAGGMDEIVRRQTQDFASLLFGPSVVGAADELSAIVGELQHDGCMLASDNIGVFGFSAGGTAALIALMHRQVPIGVAVTINASTGLQQSVDAYERATNTTYNWTTASRALAKDTDAIAHAEDIAHDAPVPALMMIQGNDDTTLKPSCAAALYDALSPYYKEAGDAGRLDLEMIPAMNHDWIASIEVDQIRGAIATWFDRFL